MGLAIRRNRPSWWWLIALALFVLGIGGVLFNLAACMSQGQVDSIRKSALDAREVAISERDRLAAAGDAEKAKQYQAIVDNIDKGLATLNPDGTINPAPVAALLPPPWNGIALVGLPLAAGLIGEIRRKRAAEDLAKTVAAVEVVKTDPAVAKAFDDKRNVVHGIMGKRAARRVKKIRATGEVGDAQFAAILREAETLAGSAVQSAAVSAAHT